MPHNGSATSLPPILSPAEKLTSAVFLTCGPMTSNPSRNATFSRASVDGPMPSDLQDGPMKDLFGQEVVHANRLARPANAKASTTTATSGLLSDSLSPSDDLQRSLESRLRARLNGSDLCEVIWKIWTTPWGQSLSKPRARVRTTSEIGSGLWATIRAHDTGIPLSQQVAATWPSPSAQTSGDTPATHEARQARVVAKHGRRMGTPLTVHAQAAAVWATATAHDRTHTPEYIAKKKAQGHGMSMLKVAATWGTPRAGNGGYGNPTRAADARARLEDQAQITNGSSERTEKPGALNPEFVCWLMGYPTVWVSCAGSETPSTRARRRNS